MPPAPRPRALPLTVLALWLLLAIPGAAPAGPVGAETRPADAAGLRRELMAHPGPTALFLAASWCPPCMRELDALGALRDGFAPRGLGVEVVSLDFDAAGLALIRERLPGDLPVHWVGEGGLPVFGVTQLPLVILLRDGREVRRITGLHTEAELRAALEELLAPAAP